MIERRDEQDGYEFGHYLDVVRRRKASLVVPTLLVVLVGWLLGSDQISYASTASVLAAPQGTVSSVVDPIETSVADEVAVISSDVVRAAAEAKIGHAVDVTVAQVSDASSVVTITVSGHDRDVQPAAQVYAETYVQVRREQLNRGTTIAIEQLTTRLTDIEAGLAELASQIEDLDLQIAAAVDATAARELTTRRDELVAQRDTLNRRSAPIQPELDELEFAAALNTTSGIELLSSAAEPVVVTGATRVPYAGAGIVVGMVIGLLLALAREHFDQSVRTIRDVDLVNPDVRVLGVVPTHRRDATQ